MTKDKTATKGGILIGIRPVIEAIQAGKSIDKVFIQRGLRGELFQELKPLLQEYDIHFQHVPIEKLNRITRKNHQGVVAFSAAVEFQNLEEIIARTFEKGEDPFILMLDRITDVRNFGAICRTAECFGVQAVVIPEKNSAPVNFDALKTSAGALNHLPVCREKNLKETLKFLKNSGLQIVSCTEKAENHAFAEKLTGPLCVIMGSEEDGVSGEYLKRSDLQVKLPMTGKIESLNVSVATGAILYEIVRQKNLQ